MIGSRPNAMSSCERLFGPHLRRWAQTAQTTSHMKLFIAYEQSHCIGSVLRDLIQYSIKKKYDSQDHIHITM